MGFPIDRYYYLAAGKFVVRKKDETVKNQQKLALRAFFADKENTTCVTVSVGDAEMENKIA